MGPRRPNNGRVVIFVGHYKLHRGGLELFDTDNSKSRQGSVLSTSRRCSYLLLFGRTTQRYSDIHDRWVVIFKRGCAIVPMLQRETLRNLLHWYGNRESDYIILASSPSCIYNSLLCWSAGAFRRKQRLRTTLVQFLPTIIFRNSQELYKKHMWNTTDVVRTVYVQLYT